MTFTEFGKAHRNSIRRAINVTPSIAAHKANISLNDLWEKGARITPQLLDKKKPVRIFGAGNFARDLVCALIDEGYRVTGFIDSHPRQKMLMDLPVVSWQEVPPAPHEQLAIAIFNRSAPFDQLLCKAQAHGFADISLPWDLYEQFSGALGWRYWLSGPAKILQARHEIEKIHARLADQTSRDCFIAIIAFRLGLNIGYGSFKHTETQYFNQLTLPTLPAEGATYVDGGAFDGDSFRELAAIANVKEAVLFEPDPENFAALNQTTQDTHTPITCLPLGLSDTYEILSFNAGSGEGGALSSSGSVYVACATLDTILKNKRVDFLKLDVEGAEIKALAGAKNILNAYRPTLTLSLYHYPCDLWEIPSFIDSICPGYQFFIRQHYFNSFDSVLYALPTNA